MGHRTILLSMLGALGSASLAAQVGPSRTASTSASVRVPPDSPAAARQGSWFGFGLGAGAASLHCQICQGDQRTQGTTGYIRAGITLSPTFLVGAEINAWYRTGSAGVQRVAALTGNAYWYPNVRHGYYFKFGFGLTNYRQSQDDPNNRDETDRLIASGFTTHVGTGYEVRVNPRMSIVPYLNLMASAGSTLSAETDDGTRLQRNRLAKDVNVLLVQIGIGLTWH